MNKATPARKQRASRRKTPKADNRFPIIAIGMSAGGLETASEFLKEMPADSGMALVIIQHLEPNRKSLLAELLGKDTAMPVVEITDGMTVEPNRVHVIKPGRTLLIKDDVLTLVEPKERRGFRHPIDKFFSALAEDRGPKAIGIVLTGAGSNGTAGLQDIKQAGGLCLAQDPETAKFDSMPRHAIGSGAVDYVLAPDKMPEALIAFSRHPYIEKADEAERVAADGEKPGLNEVLALLRARTGLDFRQYKPSTLTRRIYRRMGLARIERIDVYLAKLRNDPNEIEALVQDLIINVTAFFRDPEAWNALEQQVVGPIVDQAVPDVPVRVWVPACSTGEESYSIAMMLAEKIEASGKPLAFKVFATDVGEQNLAAARKGLFAGSMVESLAPERLDRFFDKVDGDYQVKQDLRESVLFAPQNLLTDPPYSRMDLVSCRNLLIYLKPEAQQRVLSLAHFALRQCGFLFLGNAETIGNKDELFETVSKRWRIYQRAGPARSSAVDFSAWPTRDKDNAAETVEPKLADVAARTLARRFAPPAVVIDGNFRIQHYHGETNAFLAHPTGAPTHDLLSIARDELAIVIRRLVQKAKAEGEVSATAMVGKKRVAVSVAPVANSGPAPLFLVSFTGDDAVGAARAEAPPPADLSKRDMELESELRSARDELRTTIEQYETSHEELKAANEEITSVNEELQATNEELESSKEELQSLNEELNAVNSQLERKVHELESAQDDLKNLLAGNEIATLFLDTHLRIKWFSPAVRSLFDLVERDIGRPIANFAQKFIDGDLIGKAHAAMEHLASFQEEVRADDDRCFSLRVQPYRTRDNRIAGVVASFIDISELKKTQAQLTEARDYAEGIVRTVHDPLLVLDSELRVVSANPAFYRSFAVQPAATIGNRLYDLGNGQWSIPELRVLLEKIIPERGSVDGFEVEHNFPDIGHKIMVISAHQIAGTQSRGDFILLGIEDISERIISGRHRDLLVGELSHRVKNTLSIVQSIASQTLQSSSSLEIFGEAFLGRIRALARAHDIVIKSGLRKIEVRDLVEQALKPFQSDGRIDIGDGPKAEFKQAAGQSLTLLLHELATNAVKYGSLSVPDGKVSIDWKTERQNGQAMVAICWIESGGPPIEPPSSTGQGLRFIQRAVPYELGGKVEIDFRPDGLVASIAIPWGEKDEQPPPLEHRP